MSVPRRITVFNNYPDYIWVLSDDSLAGGNTRLSDVPGAYWGAARTLRRAISDAKRQQSWLRRHSYGHEFEIVHEEIIHR